MSGDGSSSDRLHINRPILSDVTNQHRKRRFLSISSSPGLDRENRFRDNVEGKAPDSEFVQKVCLGVENLVRGKCKRDCVKDLPVEKPIGLCSSLKSGIEHGPLNDDKISGVPSDIQDAMTGKTLENSDGLRDCSTRKQCYQSGCYVSVIVEEGCQDDKQHVKAGVDRDAIKGTLENEVSDTELMDGGDLVSTESALGDGFNHGVDMDGGDLASTKSSLGDGFNHGVDMLNGCSCSFCEKAAYIWSDLHYQDVKGRVAAIKKSQKEVKFCVEKSLGQYETDKNGMTNLDKSTKLELDLMGRWKSLFLHTEDILVHESTQLQSSLLSLKELRRSCKTELEMTNGVPSNK